MISLFLLWMKYLYSKNLHSSVVQETQLSYIVVKRYWLVHNTLHVIFTFGALKLDRNMPFTLNMKQKKAIYSITISMVVLFLNFEQQFQFTRTFSSYKEKHFKKSIYFSILQLIYVLSWVLFFWPFYNFVHLRAIVQFELYYSTISS